MRRGKDLCRKVCFPSSPSPIPAVALSVSPSCRGNQEGAACWSNSLPDPLISNWKKPVFQVTSVRNTAHVLYSRPFSTASAEPILVRARDPAKLAEDLTDALDGGRLHDAWRLYEQHLHMDGFPRKSVLTALTVSLTESFDDKWVSQAYDLVESVIEQGKSELLEKDCLLYLSFILARIGMHVPAATVLRRLVEMEEFPPVALWTGVIAYFSQTAEGAFLAAEIVGEFGYLFKDHRVDPRKKSNRPLLAMKPNCEAFNVALTGCLVSGLSKKAEQILEMMPRVDIRPDGDLLIVMALIYDKNGRIDEIKKLKRYVDEACDLSSAQFQQFYECLLSCHLKFGDIESASKIVLAMLRKAKEAKHSLAAAKLIVDVVENGKSFTPMMGMEQNSRDSLRNIKWITSRPPLFRDFCRDRSFPRLSIEAKELLHHLCDRLRAQVELVRSEHGILNPTEKIYAKLARGYLEAGRMPDLASFLIEASKEDTPVSNENSVVVQVIYSCISLNLLDQAHDLLDEMRFHGVRIGSSVYSSLLKAYCKQNRSGEIRALLRDAKKAGVQLDTSCYEALIQLKTNNKDIDGALQMFKEMKDSSIIRSSNHDFELITERQVASSEAELMASLLEEIKDNRKVNCGLHDWNSVIHFFCKKRMMQDAQKALKQMRALGHCPNSQTFHSLVTAYAGVGGKYVEVTDLWGEMKLLANTSSLEFDQELLDSLLYCFVRGGFFIRANEVVNMMERGRMFIDKYKYRTLWLKYHKTLYKGKAPKIQTEAQCERREAALSFKKWLNLM